MRSEGQGTLRLRTRGLILAAAILAAPALVAQLDSDNFDSVTKERTGGRRDDDIRGRSRTTREEDGNAFDFRNRVSHLLKHLLDLVRAPFFELDPDPGVILA